MKETQDRKEIEIKKIENSSNKQVTFSKRSAAPASFEAVIVFSNAIKVFCYGHPDVHAVIESYQNGLSSVVGADDKVKEVELVMLEEREREQIGKLEEQGS